MAGVPPAWGPPLPNKLCRTKGQLRGQIPGGLHMTLVHLHTLPLSPLCLTNHTHRPAAGTWVC